MARLNRCLGCLKSQTNISDVAPALPATLGKLTLAPDKDGILFLVCFFRLFGLAVLVCSGRHIVRQPRDCEMSDRETGLTRIVEKDGDRCDWYTGYSKAGFHDASRRVMLSSLFDNCLYFPPDFRLFRCTFASSV